MATFFQSLLSCFGRREGSVKLADSDTKPGCVFCNVSPSRSFDVVWKSSTLVVFRDRDPAAREHLLVTPARHIPSVKELHGEDIALLRDMEDAGHRALDMLKVPPDVRRMGFHIPPFNSVMHLHLHVFCLPFKSAYSQVIFRVSKGAPGKNKGFSWFVEIGQAIGILEAGEKITVFPC